MSFVTRNYLYAENYDDYADHALPAAHFHWSSLTRIVLTILLRVGYILIQVGSVPVNNVNLILLQNVIDLCCVTVMYFLTGFLVAYNGDVAGLIGAGHWIGDPSIDKNEAIIGWQAIVITSAIYTTAVAGRMHAAGYLLVNILISGLIQPLIIHWAWTAEGWMTENVMGGSTVTFKDYAGAAVIHVVGGLSGLIGCVVLGRRVLRLKDLDDASITAGSAGTVFGGLLLIFAGLQGLFMNMYDRDKFRMFVWDPSHAYVNNLLAASSCTLLVVALHFTFNREPFNHWIIMRCVQGTIAGVVMVSAGANDYSPQIAIILGCLGGIAFYLVSQQIFRSALEDYCNIIAVHLVCAILGSILAPICAARTDENTVTILLSLSWQLICLIALSALVGITMLLIFGMLECCNVLRNKSECLNHSRANAAAEKGPPRSFLQRLFFPDTRCFYLQPGSISNAEHHSKVNPRSWRYQAEIDKLEEGRPAATNKLNMSVKTEDNLRIPAPAERIKKARQVHTLSANIPVLIEEDGIGESVNNNLSETGRKQFLERGVKYVLDPIEEIDEEVAKELEVRESCAHNIENYNSGDKYSTLTKTSNTFTESKNLNESNYQLRRTVKLTNLHHEFIKEDLKIVLEPKRLDSSSSDSCDEDVIFTNTLNLNESVNNIATALNSVTETTPHVKIVEELMEA